MRIKNKLISTIAKRFSSVTFHERNIISDASDAELSQTQNNSKRTILQFISSAYFHPTTYFMIWFKLTLAIFTSLNLFYIPMALCFDIEQDINSILFMAISFFMISIEIIIKFRIAFFDNGELVSIPSKIFMRYLLVQSLFIRSYFGSFFIRYSKNEFFFDILSLIGLLLGIAHHFLSMLILFRIPNLRKYISDIDNHFFLTERYHAIWVLSKLFLFIMMMAHYFACLFHIIALIKSDDAETDTWLKAL